MQIEGKKKLKAKKKCYLKTASPIHLVLAFLLFKNYKHSQTRILCKDCVFVHVCNLEIQAMKHLFWKNFELRFWLFKLPS